MKLSELLGAELYAQVEEKIKAANEGQTDKAKIVRFVDLSEGSYVGKERYNSEVSTLTQQVTDLQGQIAQRDTDMADLQGKLTAVQADAGKLTEAQEALTGLQSKYEADRQEWEQKNAQQAYEFMVRSKASELKFSSNAAKNDFIREAITKNFKVDGNNLLGYGDFVEHYKESDPSAFAEDKPAEPTPAPAPTVVLPKNPTPPTDKDAFGFKFNGVRPKPED